MADLASTRIFGKLTVMHDITVKGGVLIKTPNGNTGLSVTDNTSSTGTNDFQTVNATVIGDIEVQGRLKGHFDMGTM